VKLQLPSGPLGAVWVGVVAYASAFSLLSILRHRSFDSSRFDLGNMTQVVWSTAHGYPLAMTDIRGEQISRLAAHVDPMLALFAPLWLAWPSPELLLVVQAIAVSLGALPLFWLGRKHLGSERASAAIALAYLLYAPLQWATLFDFHPLTLAAPLLLFAVWFLDEERYLPFVLVALLAATTKEQVGLLVAGLGLWHAWSRRRVWPGAAIAASGVALTLLAVFVVIPQASGGAPSPFLGRYETIGGSPRGLAETLVREPLTIVGEATEPRDLGYLAALSAPLLGAFAAAPALALGALPEVALNVLSDAPAQTSIRRHYAAGIVPFVFAATVFGLARLRRRRGRGAGLVLVAVLASNVVLLGPFAAWPIYGERLLELRRSDRDRLAARLVALVPPAAGVTATHGLGAHLSARRRFYSFPNAIRGDWVLVDLRERSSFYSPAARTRALVEMGASGRWCSVLDAQGFRVYRRSADGRCPARLRFSAG